MHEAYSTRCLRNPKRLGPVLLCLLFFAFHIVTCHAQSTGASGSDTSRAGAGALWFGDVRAPVSISRAAARELGHTLFAALRSGERPEGLEVQSADPAGARIVALSYSAGKTPAQVEYGTGATLHAAAQDAVQKILAGDSDTENLAWLKIDVVQHALQTPAFVMQRSQLPLPGLVGIAFSPVSGIAFLPEVLVAYDCIRADRKLDPRKAARRFVERKAWKTLGKWNTIATYQGAQTVSFFESQSWFCDGNSVTPLFRGHVLPEPVSRSNLQRSIVDTADFLVAIHERNDSFIMERAEWDAGVTGEPGIIDMAGTVLALQAAGEHIQDSSYGTVADRALEKLIEQTKPYPGAGGAVCLAQNYSATVEANSLAVLALLKRNPDENELLVARRIGHFLLDQVQEDGLVLNGRSTSNWAVDTDYTVRGTALTILALVRLYEATATRTYLNAAQLATGHLVQRRLETTSLDQLSHDPWVRHALNALYTYERSGGLVKQMARLAAAVEIDQLREARVPDLLGSIDGHPSTVKAARALDGLTAAAELLRDAERTDAVQKLNSSLHLGTLFMLQAQLRPPAVMYLESPRPLLGAFSEDIQRVRLSLAPQWEALLSLTRTLSYLKTFPQRQLPLDREARLDLQNARQAVATFPRLLPARPPAPGRGQTP